MLKEAPHIESKLFSSHQVYKTYSGGYKLNPLFQKSIKIFLNVSLDKDISPMDPNNKTQWVKYLKGKRGNELEKDGFLFRFVLF